MLLAGNSAGGSTKKLDFWEVGGAFRSGPSTKKLDFWNVGGASRSGSSTKKLDFQVLGGAFRSGPPTKKLDFWNVGGASRLGLSTEKRLKWIVGGTNLQIGTTEKRLKWIVGGTHLQIGTTEKRLKWIAGSTHSAFGLSEGGILWKKSIMSARIDWITIDWIKEIIMQYKTKGTCSTMINLTLDDNHVIQDVHFTGGCNGNLQGISKLVVGQKAEDVIGKIEGIRCGFRNTSCPDQLAKALRQAIAQ